MVPRKTDEGLRKFWPDLEISEAFWMGLEVSESRIESFFLSVWSSGVDRNFQSFVAIAYRTELLD